MLSPDVTHDQLKDIVKAMDLSTAIQQLMHAHDKHYHVARFRHLIDHMTERNDDRETLNEIHKDFPLNKID